MRNDTTTTTTTITKNRDRAGRKKKAAMSLYNFFLYVRNTKIRDRKKTFNFFPFLCCWCVIVNF